MSFPDFARVLLAALLLASAWLVLAELAEALRRCLRRRLRQRQRTRGAR
jgi:ABC-type uncharacterized transport system permease subunit